MGKLNINPTSFEGVYVINTNTFNDERGTFARWFCMNELKNILGDQQIVNINYSHTINRGSIRGMHFQYPPCTETKIVRCIRGKILDVIVDIRKNSPTFLQYFAVELSANDMNMLYIPKGFAHGFQSLEDNSDIMYLVTAYYSAEKESGLNALDPKLGIKWPLPIVDMSDKDRNRSKIEDDFEGIDV